MPSVERKGNTATCGGHSNTGSNSVFINNAGATRVIVDTAGGLIIGPGSQTVFVEGSRVSLEGDSIATHGKSPHKSAKTANGSTDVFAGTGFIGDPGGSQPKADLVVIDFTASINIANTSGQPYYPKKWDWWECLEDPITTYAPPFVTFDYTVRNDGTHAAQPFSVGFWKLPTKQQGGILAGGTGVQLPFAVTQVTYSDPQIQDFYSKIYLVDEEKVGSLQPGDSFSGQFTFYDLMYVSQKEYNFGLYADIYMETTEPDENNSTTIIKIPVNVKCGGV